MERIGILTTTAAATPAPKLRKSQLAPPLTVEVSAELTAMFLALTLPKELAEAPALAKQLYAEALAGLDQSDAIAVIRDFRLGKYGDGNWAPKPGKLRQQICERDYRRAMAARQERLAAEILRERRDYRALMAQREASGERARVAKGLTALAAELKARRDGA